MTKKALFLRLSPKKVDSFPKIASSFGDSLCGSARKKTSYSNKKCTFLSKKCIFLEILTSFSSLLYYLCSGFQKKHKNIIIITLTFAYLKKKHKKQCLIHKKQNDYECIYNKANQFGNSSFNRDMCGYDHKFFSSKHKNIIIITLPFAYLQKKSYLCGVIKSINFKITTL